MPIPTEIEPDTLSWPQELCCFCWHPTKSWTNLPDRKPGEQVACCETCANDPKNRRKDVPTKRYWCMVQDKKVIR